MRLYTFVHGYLSSIQHGIQSTHVLGDMFVKYSCSGLNSVNAIEAKDSMWNWAEFNKTMVVLNGGNSASLHNIYDVCEATDHAYCKFYEDEESLQGVLTCVGIVLPLVLCEAIDAIRKKEILLAPNLAGKIYYNNTVISLADYNLIMLISKLHRA